MGLSPAPKRCLAPPYSMWGAQLGQPCTGGGMRASMPPTQPGCLHGTLHPPMGCCGTPLPTATSPLAAGGRLLQTTLFKTPFPKSRFPEDFRCPGTRGVTHPCICTFCSFLLCLPYFAGENEIIPVLLEGLTVPWLSASWENTAMSPATAVWRQEFLGTTERLYEHLCLLGGGKLAGKT